MQFADFVSSASCVRNVIQFFNTSRLGKRLTNVVHECRGTNPECEKSHRHLPWYTLGVRYESAESAQQEVMFRTRERLFGI